MNVIEIDAASNNGVDNIREIREEVAYSPTEGRYKVYIIDEVHMLSIGAFNALLKTLEEPPEYVVFILATDRDHKIPVTILSRCQRYDFKRISIETISDRLRELIDKEERGCGGQGGALYRQNGGRFHEGCPEPSGPVHGLLHRQTAHLRQCAGGPGGGGRGRVQPPAAGASGAGCEKGHRDCGRAGDAGAGADPAGGGFHLVPAGTLLLVQSIRGDGGCAGCVHGEPAARLKEEAQMIEPDMLLRYIRIFSELSGQLKYATQKRVMLEVALIKLCTPAMEVEQDTLPDRIRAVEEKLEKGIPAGAVLRKRLFMSAATAVRLAGLKSRQNRRCPTQSLKISRKL